MESLLIFWISYLTALSISYRLNRDRRSEPYSGNFTLTRSILAAVMFFSDVRLQEGDRDNPIANRSLANMTETPRDSLALDGGELYYLI